MTEKKEIVEKSVKKTYTSQIRATQKYLDKFYIMRTRLPLEWEPVLKDIARDRGVSLNQLVADTIERELINKSSNEKGV